MTRNNEFFTLKDFQFFLFFSDFQFFLIYITSIELIPPIILFTILLLNWFQVDFPAAMIDYDEALKLEPEFGAALYNRATINYRVSISTSYLWPLNSKKLDHLIS